MKTNNFRMSALAYIAGVAIIFTLGSCSTKAHFLTSTILPAAQGTVSVRQDGNHNYAIKVEISNLAPSERLTPPMSGYVVWLVAQDNSTQNLGQLNSSNTFMSKNLGAKFETVSSTKPMKIVITAENDVTIQNPGFTTLILTTDNLK